MSLQAPQYELQGWFELIPRGIEVGMECFDGGSGDIRCGNEVLADLLRQGLDERSHQFHPQSGDLPLEGRRFQLVKEKDRNLHRDAVGCAGNVRRELIAQRQFESLLVPRLRKSTLVEIGIPAEQLLGLEVQQVRAVLPGLLPPLVEVALRDNVGAHTRIIKGEESLVVDHEVAAAHPVFHLFDLRDPRLVAVEELVMSTPVALDQCMPDEELACDLPVDSAVVDAPLRDNRHAVECDLLVRHD